MSTKKKNVIHLFAVNNTDFSLIDVNVGSIKADNGLCVKALRKAIENYSLQDYEIRVGYEAGPTGYSLCRDLNKEGFFCEIIAPSSIPKAPADKVKTDRIDAAAISHLLSSGAYKPVFLLDEEDYCTREVVRRLTSLRRHAADIRREIKMFLLRNNKTFTEGSEQWTKKYRAWLEKLTFGNESHNYVFHSLLHDQNAVEDEIEELELFLDGLSESGRYKERVDKLVCFAGIDRHIALALCCEIGDFNRFATAGEFASYLGLTPGQDSSGKRVRFTGITKCGNAHLRTLLTESSKAIYLSNQKRKSKKIKVRQLGKDPLVIEYADRGSKRIHDKMFAMRNYGGKSANVATTAGVRELACFVWGMMTGNMSRTRWKEKREDAVAEVAEMMTGKCEEG